MTRSIAPSLSKSETIEQISLVNYLDTNAPSIAKISSGLRDLQLLCKQSIPKHLINFKKPSTSNCFSSLLLYKPNFVKIEILCMF